METKNIIERITKHIIEFSKTLGKQVIVSLEWFKGQCGKAFRFLGDCKPVRVSLEWIKGLICKIRAINFKEYFKSHFDKSVCLTGLGILLAGILIFVTILTVSFKPLQSGKVREQIFTVDKGASIREVANHLQASGLIRNSFVYEWYVRLSPGSRMAKSGRYKLSATLPLQEIVAKLSSGISQEIMITVKEGLTNKEVAQLFADKEMCDVDKFLAVLDDRDFMRSILGDLYTGKFSEGFLFPDTYSFELNSSERQLVTTMLKQYKTVWQNNFSEISMKEHDRMLIMASLVEKEAQKPEDRPVIAGVFYNRIRKGMALQSCATVQYALGERKTRLLYKDLQINSPYNTYKQRGLPPGPIANPGLASLKAAAFPSKVTYLYFVARSDGSHVFSNTFSQHIAAQRRVK